MNKSNNFRGQPIIKQQKWWNMEIHRVGQAKGIDYVFTDYRIRVGSKEIIH